MVIAHTVGTLLIKHTDDGEHNVLDANISADGVLPREHVLCNGVTNKAYAGGFLHLFFGEGVATGNLPTLNGQIVFITTANTAGGPVSATNNHLTAGTHKRRGGIHHITTLFHDGISIFCIQRGFTTHTGANTGRADRCAVHGHHVGTHGGKLLSHLLL